LASSATMSIPTIASALWAKRIYLPSIPCKR
jgi:hypothetical protein